jgi:ADP-heptose:LPS heptosyltransferase
MRSMKTLIIKLNATGDVVRTTPLLRCLEGDVMWITARKNTVLLDQLTDNLRCVTWEDRDQVRNETYDRVINLEDDVESAAFTKEIRCRQMFGAYLDGDGTVTYTEDARAWFDMSIVSRYGKTQADALKFNNRKTYQELIFQGLGLQFNGERYLLPEPHYSGLSGDVAIAPVAGAVWPMKNWAYYERLQQQLEGEGLRVNVLPARESLLEHLGDIHNHRCLVSGDSLPMHLALGSEMPCVSLFSCTSPWEIHEYGVQKKIVSRFLPEFFYRRDFDRRATTAISLSDVHAATIRQLRGVTPVASEDVVG